MSGFIENTKIYTNNGIKFIQSINTNTDMVLDKNNTFVSVKKIINNGYNKIINLNIEKTQMIKTTEDQHFLTIKKFGDEPVWKKAYELRIDDYVAITSIRLNTNNDDENELYLLMGIFITCGTLEGCNNDNITFTVSKYRTLYDFDKDGLNDKDIVTNIINKHFGLSCDVVYDNDNDTRQCILKYTNNNDNYEKLKTFLLNIDNDISPFNKKLDNYYNLHDLVKGMYFNHIPTKYKYYVVCKDNDTATKYYNILRCYGMDIGIKDNLLIFNNIYVINMNDMDPNDPAICNNPNIISCFYANNNYYDSEYTFLKVNGIEDTNKFYYTYSLEMDNDDNTFSVENVITK